MVLREEVLHLLKRGEIVALPTESSFALSVSIDSGDLSPLFTRYKVGRSKPIPVMIGSVDLLTRYVSSIPPLAEGLIERYWPGPLTILFPAKETVPREIHRGTGLVGIRVPGFTPLQKLLQELGEGVTATSANLPGEPPITTITELKKVFPDLPFWDIVSETPGGAPSTVVDLSKGKVEIVRPGRIPL